MMHRIQRFRFRKNTKENKTLGHRTESLEQSCVHVNRFPSVEQNVWVDFNESSKRVKWCNEAEKKTLTLYDFNLEYEA